MKIPPGSPTLNLQKYNSYDVKPNPPKIVPKPPTPKNININDLRTRFTTKSTKGNEQPNRIEFEKLKTNGENSIKSSRRLAGYEGSIYDNYKRRSNVDEKRRSSSKKSEKFVALFGVNSEINHDSKNKDASVNKRLDKKTTSVGRLKPALGAIDDKTRLDRLLDKRRGKNIDSLKIKNPSVLSDREGLSPQKVEMPIKIDNGIHVTKKNNIYAYQSHKRPVKSNFNSNYRSNDKGRLVVHKRVSSKLSIKGDYKNPPLMTQPHSNVTLRPELLNNFTRKVKKPKPILHEYTFTSKTHKGYSYFDLTKKNQDSYFVINKLLGFSRMHLIGVCDGHGQEGHTVSAFVKDNFPIVFEAALKSRIERNNGYINEDELYKNNHYELDIFEALKNTVNKLFSSDIDVYFSGTTLNCLFIFGSNVIICNVGDSRAIMIASSNLSDIIKLSKDHKPTDTLEKTRLLKHNARIEQTKSETGDPYGPMRVWLQNEDHPGLAMSRSIGDLVGASIGITWKPYVLYKELSNSDDYIVVIATDGIWDVLSNSEVMSIVRKHWLTKNVDRAGEDLMAEAVKRWTSSQDVLRDDITFVIGYICT